MNYDKGEFLIEFFDKETIEMIYTKDSIENQSLFFEDDKEYFYCKYNSVEEENRIKSLLNIIEARIDTIKNL